ncbi:hypothetical protein DMUE_2754 [Dictyocoela muelleri]|nr:hypothetical protein DMUE_2754 [Dictyocoela muelleri]
MTSNDLRKKRTTITKSHFYQIFRLRNNHNVSEISEITGSSLNSIYKLLKLFTENDQVTFKEYNNIKGRLKLNKNILISKIINLYGNDNSLTHKGAQEKLSEENINLSMQKVGRIIKESGLKRKKIHKKSNIIFNDSHKNLRREYCIQILMLRRKKNISRRIRF